MLVVDQMEELNEGGLLFLKRQPNLRMRLCHGNTLTTGVILNGLPIEVEEIFLTGATSKLGRAVSITLQLTECVCWYVTESGALSMHGSPTKVDQPCMPRTYSTSNN
jgi:hypothetical protein